MAVNYIHVDFNDIYYFHRKCVSAPLFFYENYFNKQKFLKFIFNNLGQETNENIAQ